MAFSRINVEIPSSLYIELKELKIKTGLKWNEFFSYLCDTIPRPEIIQSDYKIRRSFKKTKNFEARLGNDAYVKFQTFAVVFLNRADAIDYLIKEEKKKSNFFQQI